MHENHTEKVNMRAVKSGVVPSAAVRTDSAGLGLFLLPSSVDSVGVRWFD